jgi:D-cysteine desulfhydrase family pyridoxal phosphate-dependent enzyme
MQPPRLSLAVLPTPLHELPRLRDALGGAGRVPRILIKRDDLTGLAFGGNKARKLEFLIADAVERHATVVITSGAVQSNHVRMTAAAARMAGLRCAVVLTTDTDTPPVQGNYLLDLLLGAEVHFVRASADPTLAVAADEEAKVGEVEQLLRERGERPYVIAVGGSTGVGTLGYVFGTKELVEQLAAQGEAPTTLYYASGSRGTQAGLVLGAALWKAPYRVRGVAVSGGEPEKILRAMRIANECAAILAVDARITERDLVTEQEYIGEAYGVATPECLEAIRLLAQCEGIFLDPVYSGKGMAGLIDHVRRGAHAPTDTIVFLHTGGTPALFAHAERLRHSMALR